MNQTRDAPSATLSQVPREQLSQGAVETQFNSSQESSTSSFLRALVETVKPDLEQLKELDIRLREMATLVAETTDYETKRKERLQEETTLIRQSIQMFVTSLPPTLATALGKHTEELKKTKEPK